MVNHRLAMREKNFVRHVARDENVALVSLIKRDKGFVRLDFVPPGHEHGAVGEGQDGFQAIHDDVTFRFFQ